MTTTATPAAVAVEARRWFDAVNGNTYHSVVVTADGREAARVDFEYGYGTAYQETAAEALEAAGLLKRERYPSGGKPTLPRALKEAGVAYAEAVTDVKRRRDL